MKKSIVGVLLIPVALLLAACTSQSTPTAQSPAAQTPVASINPDQIDVGEDGASSSASMSVREIKIEAFGYGFTPKTIEVAKGEKVKFVITNKGGMHDFTMKDFNISQGLSSTTPTVVEFSSDKAGTFEFICSVGNHAAMGMKGTVVVK